MSAYTVESLDLAGPDTDKAPGEGMLTCDTCGISFDHVGRGRKPKNCPDCRATKPTRATTPRKSTKDVEAACAVLESAYSTVALGLFVVNPRAASVWVEQCDRLQVQNRLTLAGDPNLTKSILRAGEKSGKAAFLISHILAVAPVVAVIREDMPKKSKRPTVKNRPTPDSQNPPSPETENPDSNIPNNLSYFM